MKTKEGDKETTLAEDDSDPEPQVEDEEQPTTEEVQQCFNRISKYTVGVKKVNWTKIRRAIEIEKESRRMWIDLVRDNNISKPLKQCHEILERYHMFRHPCGVSTSHYSYTVYIMMALSNL